MALWDRVLSSVDINDDTNFDTRIIAMDNGTRSLYSACTMATIQSSEQVNQKPNILASILHSKLFIAIDKSITIFEDETCDSILFNTNFTCLVTCYCLSRDGLFLFIALADRSLCCFYISEKRLLSVIPIPDNQANISDNMISMSFKSQGEEVFVILVSDTGAIYRVSLKLYPKDLKVTSPNDDKNTMEDCTIHVRNSFQIFEGLTFSKFFDATVNISSQELSVFAAGTNSVFTWPNLLCNKFNDVFPFEYIKIKPLTNSGKMLCLRTDRILSVICSDTLLALKICDSPVFDFIIIQCDNVDHCEILFLTQSKNSETTYTLRLISYPDFKQRFEVNVPATTCLVENSLVSDNVIYIEGVTAENEIINTFKIKMLSESIPEMRLARLLRKRQFAAAEDLVKRFSLSMESIYYFQATSYIEELVSWTESSPNPIDIDVLINILDKIQNVEYIIECCSKAIISDYIQMRQLYLYARRRIIHDMKLGNTSDQLNANLSLINDRLHRLETFQLIKDIESNDAFLHDDTVINNWIRFSQANLLNEFNVHLRTGQMKSATIIWSRHLPDVIKHISVKTVENIFATVPEDTAPSCLWPWLVHFVPTLVSLLPDAIREIVSWGLKKLRDLEISHCTLWPEIGIDFAEKFIKLLQFQDNPHYVHQDYKYQNSSLKRFVILSQILSDIQQLKVAYRLKVPLDLYINSPVEAAHTLLDKVHLDKIIDFVDTFLKRYMLSNNLQIEAVLCAYVQKTITNSNSWWFGEEAAWEKRVAIITSLIYNVENRLETTLQILKSAPVPWSSAINTLAETNSNLNHDLSSKIKIERDYVSIKIIFKKYGYATIDINKLISRIVKENRDSMINDIDVLTKNNQRLKRNAFCRCVSARLKEGNLQKAMDVVYHVENDIADALYCYETITSYVVAGFSIDNVILKSLDCWMEILDYFEFKICNSLARSKVNFFCNSDIIGMIKDLKALYILKKDYKTNVTLKDYHTQKSLVLQKCIAKLLPNAEDIDLLEVYTTVVKIATVLGLEKSHATLSLFKQVKDVDVLRQLVNDDDIYSNQTSSEFKNINEICLSTLQHDAANADSAEIIENISALMLNTCQDADLSSALSLHTCVGISPVLSIQRYADTKQGIASESNYKLYTIYKDQAISLDQRLLSLFKDAIAFQLYCSNWTNGEETKNYNEQTNQLLSRFLTSIKEMQFQHNDCFLFQIFTIFYSAYCRISTRDENTLTEMKAALSQLVIKLLRKLCIGRSFDLQLGLVCLFALSEREACNWITTTYTSFQADHIRHFIISNLGYEYSRLAKNWSLMQLFEGYKLLNIWAQRLSPYSIAYKEMLTSDTSSKRDILQRIISSNKKNLISLLKDYCCSFAFHFDDCLLFYLQTIVKTWNPTITVSSVTEDKEIVVSEEEVAQLRKECEAIVAQIEDKSVLTQFISKLWKQVNFYHYEVFVILMDLIQDKDLLKKNCLCFLQNYTRNGPPTSMEHYKWAQLYPEHKTLPPIAQWRLPFLLAFDIWKLVGSELNLRTYEKWLDVAPILNLETHLVCTLAIKGEVTQVWGNNSISSKNDAWSLNLKNIALLKDIRKCVQRITDSDRFYYGTAALYYVMNHTPAGADRVAAAKECYEYARLAARNSTKFEEGMLEKIEFKYLSFTSEHILRTHGLEQAKYFALIKDPCKLIRELYNDESVPLRYRSVTNYRPDINSAVKELSELFSLNMTKLRLELLQEWLRFNGKYNELSQSFTETLSLKFDRNADFEDNLFRTCYMLECQDTDLFVQFLVSVSFGDHDGAVEYDYNVRYRALRVLQVVIDTVVLEKLTKRDASTLRSYMRSLYCISKLELLGLCYNINTFETCCKQELVQSMWKNQPHLPYTVSVVAQICIQFEIYDILLWDSVLNEMTKFRMVDELKRVLLRVRNSNDIVNCNSYRTGWQLIISEPFNEMEVNPSSEQVNNCIEAIYLLYSCPIVYELDFSAVVSNCLKCKQMHLAAALLPFLSESERKFVSKTIKQDYQQVKLAEDLNYLSSKGILIVTRVS